MQKINNIGEVAAGEWMVARKVDGEFWFYGSYESYEKASNIAQDIDGILIEVTKEYEKNV